VKSDEEVDALRRAAEIVSGVHGELAPLVLPGGTTKELDRVAEEYIRDCGAEPAFKGYIMSDETSPYPATLCTSANDVVVHGFPSEVRLNEGDILSVDVGVKFEGFYGDCAATYGVGEITADDRRLLEVTIRALYAGIEAAEEGNWVFDIARAVQEAAESAGFGVVRDLVGHGIGRSLHEDPAVPNFVPNPFARHRYQNRKLEEGMVICIEPMITGGSYRVETDKDEWTVRTVDRSRAAHFEHMVHVGRGEAEILTEHIVRPVTTHSE
jgi:methionyl aminopeptidase